MNFIKNIDNEFNINYTYYYSINITELKYLMVQFTHICAGFFYV